MSAGWARFSALNFEGAKMIGRKVDVIPSDSPPNPGPEAIDQGPADEFKSEADQEEVNKPDLKPGSQPDGTASGVSDRPHREPGIEEVE
jgi:hypothetical protein